jgi:hypothetical protein
LEGESGGGAPGEGPEVADGLPALGGEGEASMLQVVEADGGEACSLEELLVVTVHEVACLGLGCLLF